MIDLLIQTFRSFCDAFFNTIRERNLQFTPNEVQRIMCFLFDQKHLWVDVDRFQLIRNAEELALSWPGGSDE